MEGGTASEATPRSARRLQTNPFRRSSVSLFTGVGGLDVGLERAGFEVRGCVELDRQARFALNRLHPDWPLREEGDAAQVDLDRLMSDGGIREGELDLLVGGPPCQPFSHASAWNQAPARFEDRRAEPFRVMLRTFAARLKPRVVLIENVPSLNTEKGRTWIKQWFTRVNENAGTSYRPSFIVLNAADYGVPQARRRLFIVAEREGRDFFAPAVTHFAPDCVPIGGQPYLTAWDAIGGLCDERDGEGLRCTGRWADLLPSIPEGSNYYHHTPIGKGVPLFGYRTKYWSFLLKLAKNRPSWTLSATPGPATGPFHWENRKLSEPELAALQTIPLPSPLDLPLRSAQRLFGNAVPGALGELLGRCIRKQLLGEEVSLELTLIPTRRLDCPSPALPGDVPSRFTPSTSLLPSHPGAGMGPRPWKSEPL